VAEGAVCMVSSSLFSVECSTWLCGQ
jgi:hypothetical protein